MTLRVLHNLGYKMTDTVWLKMRDLEYLYDREEDGEGTRTESFDTAFTF